MDGEPIWNYDTFSATCGGFFVSWSSSVTLLCKYWSLLFLSSLFLFLFFEVLYKAPNNKCTPGKTENCDHQVSGAVVPFSLHFLQDPVK